LVRAAFFAAADRWPALLARAIERACRDSALRDTADRPSRFSALRTARDRLAEGLLREGLLRFRVLGRAVSRLVLLRPAVFPAVFPGLGSFTPAWRAFDSPMAIACLVERAPCFPSRTWWISSRTNSPAWVDGDFPSRASSRARSIVLRSGMLPSF